MIDSNNLVSDGIHPDDKETTKTCNKIETNKYSYN